MNLIKIAITLKNKFSEFYEVNLYRKQASRQFVVRQYKINNQKITINEEKSNG
ncbi:hypothetical protein HYX00_02320 [Candidatus Woesearchaeota archaeon]|nr:hypothetical protein [Candidatus Woesearchaeota archaeon]